MPTRRIRLILILMLLTVSGLFITQAYWFKKAFALQERQFEDKINIALRNVADRLLKLDQDSNTRIPPVVKLSSNEFYVQTSCYFSIAELDQQITREFALRNINIDFDYIIVKTETSQILLGNSFFTAIETFNAACLERLDNKENLDFRIRMNNKTTYLIESMGIWLYSSFSLLLILVVFTFIMISIIKGKKLSLLKKDFINNMTHELKTPIANIAVASDVIKNGNIQMDDQKIQKYASIIYNENVRLHNLVDHVLQISAIEKKDESLSFEVVDIHEIIRDISFSFDPLIQQKNGVIQSFLKANNINVRADRTHISNVIYNLIENAIKYSKDSPEITISTADRSGGINLEISDKGIGINKKNQNRIFEKFFRAETGDLHNTKGFGLGLSYVKLIVEKHQGLITFTSKERVGSVFNVFLPV